MSIALGHAWLQKHPTPSAAAGEFHWHGEGACSPDDAALRGRVVEEVQKLAAPAVWWELSPRRVIWAAVFSAVSPTDARPYRGIALTVASATSAGESGGPSSGPSAAAMLAQLRLAAAAPFGVTAAAGAPAGERGHGPRDAELARAILSGGAATVDDPHDARWPAALARLVRALPAALQDRTVSGQLTDAATTMLPHGGGDQVAELLARVGRGLQRDVQRSLPRDEQRGERGSEGGDGGEADRAAWQLLCELAESDGRASAAAGSLRAEVLTALLDEIMGESQRALTVRFSDRATKRFERALRAWTANRPGALSGVPSASPSSATSGATSGVPSSATSGVPSGKTSASPSSATSGVPSGKTSGAPAAPASWRQLLHGWGRGWLGDEPALTARLAEELALRALAELDRGGQAQTVLAEARWQALLPAARRRALWQELARRAPCLAGESPFPRPLPGPRQESFHAT